jgi:hypothetical protein
MRRRREREKVERIDLFSVLFRPDVLQTQDSSKATTAGRCTILGNKYSESDAPAKVSPV